MTAMDGPALKGGGDICNGKELDGRDLSRRRGLRFAMS